MNSYFLTLDAALFTGSSFLEILTGNLKNIYMKIVWGWVWIKYLGLAGLSSAQLDLLKKRYLG